jgi:sugar (pentulose or hexulose) kinase
MTADHILAIDVGTQSVRALLFDLSGKLAAKAQVPFEPYHAEQPGWAEQRPEYFWERLCDACQKLWSESTVPKSAVAGVALTSQRGTVINVDSAGKPLRPAMVWPDSRRTTGEPALGGMWGAIFTAIRMTETIAYIQAEAEANWIRTHQPDIWQKTHKYLLLSGYLTYRLTSRFVDSVGCQVGYLPFDYKKLQWSGGRDWKWQAIPMRPDILPELVPPSGLLGEITPEAAAATGIPAGLPMIAAAADKACEVIGSGSLTSNIGCLSFGSNATINITYQKYVEAIPLIPPYPAALPGAYTTEIQVPRGYWMVSWFKQEFAHLEREIAEKTGAAPETLFDDLVNATPPGADGLILQPYWAPGLRIPGPEARGAIIGWTNVHTRAHLYRAILEGLAYALREGKERCEKRGGIPVTELRVTGGGSQSDAALQLTADIFGLTASRVENFEASGLGAAIDAAVGLKLHPNFETAIAAMVRRTRTFEPNRSTQALYDDLYHNVYQPMYGKLSPLYKALQAILR